MEDHQGVHALTSPRHRGGIVKRLLVPALALGTCLAANAADPDPERQLLTAFDQWQAGHVREAWESFDRLVKQFPNFRLAQLLYGELLSARSGLQAPDLLVGSDLPEVRELVDEARVRLREWRQAPREGALPDVILDLSPKSRYAVVVDLPSARLYVVENAASGPKLIRSYYAAMGRNGAGKQVEGDNRTPIGVYRATGFLQDAALPELYGAGALPLDYPNNWDRRGRKTGSGIWLHGVPRQTYSRAPLSSEGCVTLANSDLMELKAFVHKGVTPVILTDRMSWQTPDERRQARQEIAAELEEWRRDWSARDTERYLSHYAADFETDGMDKQAFSDYKRRVNASKSSIEVSVSELELLRYPDEKPMVLARFRQDYRSDNFRKTTVKEQYWRRDARGTWKIVKEATS